MYMIHHCIPYTHPSLKSPKSTLAVRCWSKHPIYKHDVKVFERICSNISEFPYKIVHVCGKTRLNIRSNVWLSSLELSCKSPKFIVRTVSGILPYSTELNRLCYSSRRPKPALLLKYYSSLWWYENHFFT